jgi:hydrogenase expression/formation protein HypC
MCLGIPGQVVAVDDAGRALATIDVGGARRSVSLACLVSPERPASSWIGEWVLVHAGFAMVHVDQAEARRTLELLEQMARLQEQAARPDPPAGAAP